MMDEQTSWVPLSASGLWQAQRTLYETEGIDAWNAKVPYYATSNPVIANAYAEVIARFLRDGLAQRRLALLEPVYVLELGAGHGLFSHYLLRRLRELRESLGLGAVRIVYVMTDLARRNLDFWRNHPALEPFVREGWLDFARCDHEIDREIRLEISGRVLRPPGAGTSPANPPGNPLIILANYIFDTLSQDLFRLRDGRLEAGLTPRACTRPSRRFEPNTSYTFADAGIETRYEPVVGPADPDEAMDAVLRSYSQGIENGYLLFPTGSLRCLRSLMRLAGDRMLLIATDKGFVRDVEVYTRNEPQLIFHGDAFSLSVSFHAIGQLFRQLGGDLFHQSIQSGLSTSVFSLGSELRRLPETWEAIQTHLETFSPANVFNTYCHLQSTRGFCSLDRLVSFLGLSRWDPYVFADFADFLLSQLGTAGAAEISDLALNLHRAGEQYFHLPYGPNVPLQLGVFYQEIGDYGAALHYYQQSIGYFGEQDVVFYNMGLCYYLLKNLDAAVEMLQAAVRENPDYIMARGWIAKIAEERSALASPPPTPELQSVK